LQDQFLLKILIFDVEKIKKFNYQYLMKTKISLNHSCPQCEKAMRPIVLNCQACDIELRGAIDEHPLFGLSSEWLHFLSVFIHCEGKIGEMEKALGVSYPTVKAKIQNLKEQISKPATSALSITEILQKIEQGDLNYAEGLEMIKNINKGK
jgi:hypothetical protein